jgi:hypothetical protein
MIGFIKFVRFVLFVGEDGGGDNPGGTLWDNNVPWDNSIGWS